jgi:NAD(P)H dehydrogenase (quinone)
VIEAAAKAGVALLAYTSVLGGDLATFRLAAEHQVTEAAIRASGLPFVLLRNGWYTENYTGWTGAAVASGTLVGSAGDGRIASAARADYAEAAAAVLTRDNPAGAIYELAGDTAWTLSDLAAEIAKQSGKPVAYKNLAGSDHKSALLGFGLPEPIAAMLANSDAGVSKGALFDEGRQLSQLIGHATTPLSTSVAAALAG